MNKNFSYLIKPASFDCNLFCDYCFYRKTVEIYPEKSVHRMAVDTYTALVTKAQGFNGQTAGYVWQGGEPTLMGLDFFKKAIEIQQRYRRPGQSISNTIQTNGFIIDDEWARFFAEHRFLVGISIDGHKDIHDKHRFTRTGKSVFNRVIAACNVLKRHNVDFNILTVVTGDSVNYPTEIYQYFLEQDFHYLQFIPCLEMADNGIAPFSIDPQSYGIFLCRLFDEWFKNGYPYVSIRLFDNFLQYMIGLAPESCMFHDTCGAYFVIEHNGDVYPCDFFVTDEWFLGNITGDSIEDILDTPRYNEFAHIRRLPREECENCQWLDFCQRGCVRFRYAPEMRYDALNYMCQSYTMFFEHSYDRYRFLAWDIKRRNNGQPAPTNIGRNDPCFCGSGKKFKKCCEPYSYILRK